MIEHFSPQYLTTNCLKNALQIPHRNVNISEACPPRPPILPTNLFQHVSGKVFAKKVLQKSFPFDENVVPKFSQKCTQKHLGSMFRTTLSHKCSFFLEIGLHEDRTKVLFKNVSPKCLATVPSTLSRSIPRGCRVSLVCHKPVPAQLATVIQNGLPSLYRRSNVQQSHQPYIPTETTIAWIKSQDFTSMRSQLAMCVKALNCCLCGGRH